MFQPTLINNLVVWEYRLRMEEASRKSLRPAPVVNYLAAPQRIRRQPKPSILRGLSASVKNAASALEESKAPAMRPAAQTAAVCCDQHSCSTAA